MKKFITGFLSGAIVFGSIGAFAATSEIKLIINGQVVQSDAPPQIINGRTMIPLRSIAEALGAKVEWDSQNRAVIVTTDDDSPNHIRHDGSDDGPLHDLNDDNPNSEIRHNGNDDGPLHDLNDDNPNRDVSHDGDDDGPDHDLNDDNGEHQNRDRDGRDN